jgi:hypothetical protein
MGNVHLSPEAEAYFARKGCKVLLQPTPEAIGVFNRSHAKKIGLFHAFALKKVTIPGFRTALMRKIALQSRRRSPPTSSYASRILKTF